MYTKLPNGQIVYEEDYSCILQPQNGKGGIYIGNLEASQNLKTLRKHNIKAVLTAAKGIDLGHTKTEIPFYLRIPGEDRDGFDLGQFFSQAISFIQNSLQKTSVMVHCLAGVSRSVCLVLAYLIKCRKMSYEDSYRLVKSKRSIIHPNDGFISQLKKFEREIKVQQPSFDSFRHSNCMNSGSVSPTKKRFEYCFQASPVQDRNTIEYARNSGYVSKVSNLKAYQSPKKDKYEQFSPYSSPYKRRNETASPNKPIKDYDYIGNSYLSKNKLHTQRFNSFTHIGSENQEVLSTSPDKKYVQKRSRAVSDAHYQTGTRRNYDRMRHASTAELSEELDHKIAQIRQKYAEYTKSSLQTNSHLPQEQPKTNGYFDENEVVMSQPRLKKKYSAYQSISSSGYSHHAKDLAIGSIKPNIGRSSVGSGLALSKLNSMRDVY